MDRWKFLIIFTCVAMTSGESDTTIKQIDMGSNEFANTLNSFGYKLTLQLLKDRNDSNVIISPVGITGLLAMVLLGSVGRSFDEISDKLGFSQDILSNRQHHLQLGKLLDGLNVNDTSSKTLYADAIFVDNSHKLREMYRTFLSKVYKGEARNVDFKDSVTAKNVINEWVSENTNEKLPQFFKEALSVDTKVVLLSALYFSGQWETPFIPEHTRMIPFTKASGETIIVNQMLNMGSFKYARVQEDGFEILAFPYNDSITTLYALKPIHHKNKTIQEVLETIDINKINNAIDHMEKTMCVIRFPKMDLMSDTKLEHSLKALGINSIFSPGEANFALMIDNSNTNDTEVEFIRRFGADDTRDDGEFRNVINSLPNPGIHVDTVVHSVKITLDEYGTEAAAATAGLLKRSAQIFYLNSPFFMFIRNEKTRLITFSAVILDPTT